jgi:hypothetical protein
MHNTFTRLDLQQETTKVTCTQQILRIQWSGNLFLTFHLPVIVHLSLSRSWQTTVALHNTSRHDIMALQEGCIAWCDHKQRDLYQLILPLKPREKIDKTDALLAHYGYTADYRHTCDLNPIELALAKIMKLVHESNVTAHVKLQKLLQVTKD